MSFHTCLPLAPNPWGPVLDSEFEVSCLPGTCNPGRINAWAGFPPCATGDHGQPHQAHQTRRCPYYRISWGEEWDDYLSKPSCTTQKDRVSYLRLGRMTQVSESWR
jgi:hypothetical protein